jgi:hypothetical protein
MRNLYDLNPFRRAEYELNVIGRLGNRGNGVFEFPLGGEILRAVISDGDNWDHVSISLAHRCPTWEEMEHVRKLVTGPNEVWVQFGVPESEHINFHPYCLHWWRHQYRTVKLPPSDMVGPKA